VDHALSYLLTHYQRADGLYRATVDALGEPVDERALLYDQAFVLLALATSAQAMPERAPDLRHRALRLIDAIRRTYAHSPGGFRADDETETFLSDPIMHLLEAAMAWIEVDGTRVWDDLAGELAEFFLDRLYDSAGGRVGEVFDRDWRPTPGTAGRLIMPGHQFEWAWLMERWSRRSGERRAQSAARRLFASGERGVDPETGLVWNSMLDDFSVHDRSSRLWPQTERLKASLLLASGSTGATSALYASARSAGEALEAYLDTEIGGLWRDSPHATAQSFSGPAPASSFYHIAGAVLALVEARLGASAATRPAELESAPPSVRIVTY
jgi:mannose-6-phosphate isomerase